MTALFLIIVLLFALGIAIGSFINVVIYRITHDDSPLRGRSYCDHCKKQISWYDNIPLLSFLLLRRRCRHCGKPIPWSYPAVEFLTGTLFVWWYLIGFTFFRLSARPFLIIQPVFWLLVGLVLVMIFFADLTYYMIPDSSVAFLTVISFCYRLFLTHQRVMTMHDFLLALLSAVGASFFFFMLYILTRKKGMGLGDVKLAFPLGLLLGWPNIIVGLFLAFVIGSAVGLLMMLFKQKKLKSIIPFGPFMVFGTLIALWYGGEIVRMYLGIL